MAKANLVGASLVHARLEGSVLAHADLSGADLSEANLQEVSLVAATLREARLCATALMRATLIAADLSGADLTGAHLYKANLWNAKLAGARCVKAGLNRVDLRGAQLDGADFNAASFGATVFEGDLTVAKNLDMAQHTGPSHVHFADLLRYKDELPEVFLRGCGLPDELIAFTRASLGAVRLYSCFISYSTGDEEFAERLYNDLEGAGVLCWKWNHDARTGKSLWGEIDQAIRFHDRLVLIASATSLQSPAVLREVERAIIAEDARKAEGRDGDVLFPVCLDGYIFEGWEHERCADVRRKVIADARGWDKNPAVYDRVRDRLIRDLRSG